MKTNINDFEDFDHYNLVWNTQTQEYDKIPKTLKAISKERLIKLKNDFETLLNQIEEFKIKVLNITKKN